MINSMKLEGTDFQCHTNHPTLFLQGKFEASRSDPTKGTIVVSGSNLKIGNNYTGGDRWHFEQGYINICVKYGNKTKTISTHNYNTDKHTSGGWLSYSSGSVTFDAETNTGTIKIIVQCKWEDNDHCQINSINDNYPVGEFEFNLPYTPYKTPVLEFSGATPGGTNNWNANQVFIVKYNSSEGLYAPASSSYYVTINGKKIGVTGTLLDEGGTITLNLENYYSSSRDGTLVQIYGERVGKGNTGNANANARLGIILWRPRNQVKSPDSSVKQEIIYDRTDIKYTWDNYPANIGIADKVHVQIFRGKDKNNIAEKVYDVTNINYSDKLFTVQSGFYSSLYYYRVHIYPRYSKQGLDGPAKIFDPFILVNRLKETKIDYPTTAYGDINWIGSRFFICFQLPEDPDVESLGGSENYNYKDVKVRLTDSGSNLLGEYSFSNNKDMFSCNSLTYRRKIVFSNKISGINVSSTPVTVKIDVYKNVENVDQEMVKSSASVVINRRQLVKYNPQKDNIIKQSDFINLVEQILKISISYMNVQGIYADTYHTITLGNIDNLRQPKTGSNDFININMACYQNLRSLLSAVLETITSYTNGTIDNPSFSVNFPVIDDFVDLQNKFIAADKETTSQYGNTNGGNYIKYGYNWIKNLMNDTDYNSFLPYNI